MVFDRNEKKQVVALLGAGSMGTAIVRRIAAGKKILLGDISEKALERVSDDFRRSGYDVETCVVNALQRESLFLGRANLIDLQIQRIVSPGFHNSWCPLGKVTSN